MVREDPENRRERLLDAAAELFVRHGFDKTTVSDLLSAEVDSAVWRLVLAGDSLLVPGDSILFCCPGIRC